MKEELWINVSAIIASPAKTNIPRIIYDIPIYILFTILATIIATVIGQIISHQYAKKRDRTKDLMQKYQEFYMHIIPSTSIYMAIKTNPKKQHDVHEAVIESDLLDKPIMDLESNIKYTSTDLMEVYERYMGYGFYSDGYGSRGETDKHALVYFMYDDLIQSNKTTNLYNKKSLVKLERLKYYYGISAMALYFFKMEDVEAILQMENFYEFKKDIRYKCFHEELLSLNPKSMALRLLEHLNYLKNTDRELFREYEIELKNFIT